MDIKNFSRKKIADGVHISCYKDTRFQKNRIEICFSDILDRKYASLNAIIPAVLSRSNSKYKTMQELNNRLSQLYAAGINDFVEDEGDIQAFGLYSYSLCNEYAFDGENVLEEISTMLRDCIFDPYLENGIFPDSVVQLQKQNMIDVNNNDINNKTRYASMRAQAIAYESEPASVRRLGENEDIEEITAESAYKRYIEILETKNVEIICVGPADYTIVEKIFTEAFSKINRRPEPKFRTARSSIKNTVSVITEEMDIEQSKLVMVYKSDYDKEQWKHAMLASYMLGGDVSSKLFTIVREKLSLCYYCSSGFRRGKFAMIVNSGVEKDNLEKARTAIQQQLDELRNGKFTDEDMEKAKLSIATVLKACNDCMDSISTWISGCIYDDDYTTPEEKINHYSAVTREQIIAAADSMKLDTVYTLTSKEEKA
ncbi:MAG: insulinase family protein [Ruminiclostridium sp.]|nr:insulinase family protein [Ruminiclostridium sp.]